jgi:hypothetical protein
MLAVHISVITHLYNLRTILFREDLVAVEIKLYELLINIVGLNCRDIWREEQEAFGEIFEVFVQSEV